VTITATLFENYIRHCTLPIPENSFVYKTHLRKRAIYNMKLVQRT